GPSIRIGSTILIFHGSAQLRWFDPIDDLLHERARSRQLDHDHGTGTIRTAGRGRVPIDTDAGRAGLGTVAEVSDADSTDTARATSLLRLLTSIPGRPADAIAIVNGLFGDALDERESSLAIPASLRAGSIALPLERDALADALAAANVTAGPKLCILVHGLMSTESIWRLPNRESDERHATYGTRLTRDHGVTTLTLRYNT